MPTIASYQIVERTSRGGGTDYVRLRFILDNGEVLDDGVRFIQSGADIPALAYVIGPQLLESAAQQEIQGLLA